MAFKNETTNGSAVTTPQAGAVQTHFPASSDLFVENVLGMFARAVSDRMDEAVKESTGLSSSACFAVVTIGSEPYSSIETLRRMLSLEHSSLVRLLNGLEEKNLIIRRRGIGQDKRSVSVALTNDGEDVLDAILDARRSVLQGGLDCIDKAEREQLITLINKIMPAIVKPGDDQHYVCRLCDLEACPQEICPVNLAHPEFYEIPEKPFQRRCSGRAIMPTGRR